MKPEVIILAAGKGTRMYSDRPKVLHEIGGSSMLHHVINAARTLSPAGIHGVIGFQAQQIQDAFAGQTDINWVLQTEQLGTGHAVQQALPGLADEGIVLVLYGDVPLVSTDTLLTLLASVGAAAASVLTLQTPTPTGLGRIIRDPGGSVTAIVEEKDASAEQKAITEINTGIMAIRMPFLRDALSRLNNNNAQGEYYLTDIIAIANDKGLGVHAVPARNAHEVMGVNNRLQLAELERIYQYRRAAALALAGATVADLHRLDVRGELDCGRDNSFDVNVILHGRVKLGDNVRIGPNCYIRDTEIGDDVTIEANSHIVGARIGSGSVIGPFARLREGTELVEKVKIGNFVETKKTVMGKGSKANHLSYIGDSQIGESVNVGAGTITCNYDGVNKHRTVLEDGVFIGSNTALVAPVTVGRQATVAAGSVITNDVPAEELAVGRGKQRNIPGWKRPQKNRS